MNPSESNSNRIAALSGIDLDRATAYETDISLRFWDKTLIPDEITVTLGIQPHIAHPAGASLGAFEPVSHPFGLWAYWACDSKASDLEEGILRFLDNLPQDLDIWRSLTTKYSGMLVCGLRFDKYHNGRFFSSAALEKIAQRGLALDLDFKFDGA